MPKTKRNAGRSSYRKTKKRSKRLSGLKSYPRKHRRAMGLSKKGRLSPRALAAISKYNPGGGRVRMVKKPKGWIRASAVRVVGNKVFIRRTKRRAGR